MPIDVVDLAPNEAELLLGLEEGHFLDLKSVRVSAAKLTVSLSAFANSDGGELYIGIEEGGPDALHDWAGFRNVEAANGHIQGLEQFFPLGREFQYEFLRASGRQGLVLHVQVSKTQSIKVASDGLPYVRRGAQNLPVKTPEQRRELEFTKGLATFETELTTASVEDVAASETVRQFMTRVVPSATPEAWMRKQQLVRGESVTVAGALLFADEPQVYLPKRSGVKITRYKTSEAEGFREALAFTPITVEGSLYSQILQAVEKTVDVIEQIPRLGDDSLESFRYPKEALHEIITNALLHRDYSITDDVHIRIFDNRIEVESPGKLPGHITIKNILHERFARNGTLVRLLNKYPDPPNKDVGEGLNTAFAAMVNLGLKEPVIEERENSVRVTIRHERLASPEQTIVAYLEQHSEIRNATARDICHIRQDYQMKVIFNRMVSAGIIEKVPGKRTAATAYRLARPYPLPNDKDAGE